MSIISMVEAFSPGLTLYDGAVTDDQGVLIPDAELPQRYAVLYRDSGTWDSEGIVRISDLGNRSFQINSVGGSQEQCLWVQDKIQRALIDKHLAIDGEHAGLIRHQTSRRPERDQSVPGRFFMLAVDQFEVFSNRYGG